VSSDTFNKERTMRHIALIALAGIVSSPAMAVGRLADVTVIDRDTGQVLTAHYHRGEYWVAGRPGAHYAVQIRNQNNTRLLAVTSIDGVNVLTGETAGVGQSGYVFDPWSSYDIAGWRKSDSEIAAFTFTSIPSSYAARTGRPQNVGVIGVALFREKALPPIAQSAPVPMAPPAMESATAADAVGSLSRNEAKAEADSGRAAPRAAPSLGTGHGRREHSEVWQVSFDREQSRPNEVIRIRYDSQQNLVAMGVIRREPLPRRQPEAFPGSPQLGYVPDP
jgi:hypothetical protein